jgi:hypothetical protein
MTDKEPLKITHADLGEPEPSAESPATPERSPGKLREGVDQLSGKVTGAVKDTSSRVAQKIADTTADATSRSADAVRDKVGEAIQAQSKATADAVEARLREIDWKGEAQKGAGSGLHWLSKRIEELAERLKADEKDSKQ